jgi:hypothetical protein
VGDGGGANEKKEVFGECERVLSIICQCKFVFFFKFFLMVFECKMWRDGDARFWRIAQ